MSGTRSERTKKPYGRPAARPRRSDGDWMHDKAPDSNIVVMPRAVTDAAPAAEPNSKLMVSNLHYEITPKDLTQIFGQMGTLIREPLIRYDRSGRSSGVAIISYETAAEARKALTHFDQKLCKGQPMSITFDAGPPPRGPRRATSVPSLLTRIQKPPLAERLASADPKPNGPPPRSNGAGPIRNKNRGGAARPAPREPKKSKNTPKSAADLDMELDAFMKDDEPKAAAAAPTEDVEMAA
ncbi:hypothetical protein BDW22DRAFT_1352145 [Trametopsis cervina]|nr:hypothetical protein BDW22DRAFT_1352145 [Trametopsis cervina]